MDAVRDLVSLLHQSTTKYAAALTGGGSGLAGRLLSVPGGSRTVLEIVVPYGEDALTDYLGARPESFCSAAVTRDIARRACERARRLAPGAAVLGLACTAGLRSDRPKRGDHRCHVAVCTARGARSWSLTLTKEARSRAEEETVVELLALNALADELGVAERVPLPLLPGEEVVTETPEDAGPLAAFLAGQVEVLCADPDGRLRLDAARPKVVLPGSFNPLHEGHVELARTAASILKTDAAFEMSVIHADKPPVPDEEVRRRLAQFTWRGAVWLTRVPTFIEKARLFPGAAFVLGADTVVRLLDPRFYQGGAAGLDAAATEFRALGCRFLVAPRVDASGTCVGVAQLAIPAPHRDLFVEVPFRRDISSTQLRQMCPT
jgi:hypothetical protein